MQANQNPEENDFPPASSADSPQPTDPETNQLRQQIEFAGGFVGWYLVNTLLWLGISGSNSLQGILYMILLPLNILAPIFLSARRQTRLVGFGTLAAFTSNLVIALLIGQAEAGWCFVPAPLAGDLGW